MEADLLRDLLAVRTLLHSYWLRFMSMAVYINLHQTMFQHATAWPTISKRVVWFIALVLAVSVPGPLSAQAVEQIPVRVGDVRVGDMVYEINSRQLSKCMPADCNARLAVWQFENCCWRVSSEELLQVEVANQSMRTIIYVHGNWMPLDVARSRALMVYRMLAARSTEPIRFIAFSWPSEQQERPARDIVTKKPLLAATSFYLASFVQRLPADQSISMIGYSFGGAIVTGALHLIAGGDLDHYCLCEQGSFHPPIRIGLFAPAFDQYALSPSGRYHRALEVVDHLYNLYNSRDPILRRFRFFDRDADPVAAGFAGLSATLALLPLEANEKIDQHDCCSVGRSHDEVTYYTCSGFQTLLANVLGQ